MTPSAAGSSSAGRSCTGSLQARAVAPSTTVPGRAVAPPPAKPADSVPVLLVAEAQPPTRPCARASGSRARRGGRRGLDGLRVVGTTSGQEGLGSRRHDLAPRGGPRLRTPGRPAGPAPGPRARRRAPPQRSCPSVPGPLGTAPTGRGRGEGRVVGLGLGLQRRRTDRVGIGLDARRAATSGARRPTTWSGDAASLTCSRPRWTRCARVVVTANSPHPVSSTRSRTRRRPSTRASSAHSSRLTSGSWCSTTGTASTASRPGHEQRELLPRLGARLGLGEHLRGLERDTDVVEVGRRLVEPELALGPAQQVEDGVDDLVGGRLAHELGLDRAGLEQGARDSHPAADGTGDGLAQRRVVDGAGADDAAHQRGARPVGAGGRRRARHGTRPRPRRGVPDASSPAQRTARRTCRWTPAATTTSGSPNASSEPSRFTGRSSFGRTVGVRWGHRRGPAPGRSRPGRRRGGVGGGPVGRCGRVLDDGSAAGTTAASARGAAVGATPAGMSRGEPGATVPVPGCRRSDARDEGQRGLALGPLGRLAGLGLRAAPPRPARPCAPRRRPRRRPGTPRRPRAARRPGLDRSTSATAAAARRTSKSISPALAPAAATATSTASSSQEMRKTVPVSPSTYTWDRSPRPRPCGGLLAEAEQRGAHRRDAVLVHARRAGAEAIASPSKDTIGGGLELGSLAEQVGERAVEPRGAAGDGKRRTWGTSTASRTWGRTTRHALPIGRPPPGLSHDGRPRRPGLAARGARGVSEPRPRSSAARSTDADGRAPGHELAPGGRPGAAAGRGPEATVPPRRRPRRGERRRPGVVDDVEQACPAAGGTVVDERVGDARGHRLDHDVAASAPSAAAIPAGDLELGTHRLRRGQQVGGRLGAAGHDQHPRRAEPAPARPPPSGRSPRRRAPRRSRSPAARRARSSAATRPSTSVLAPCRPPSCRAPRCWRLRSPCATGSSVVEQREDRLLERHREREPRPRAVETVEEGGEAASGTTSTRSYSQAQPELAVRRPVQDR